jgi:Gas vesicle synthesis protein GvpL/GvpF
MRSAGSYLYGFTDHRFQPRPDLRGLAGAPLRVLPFRDVAAVVSRHPVQPLMPLRSNLEPHHRIVRHISSEATLVPAAFGHISETDDDIVGVLRDNYDGIREELERLAQKCEMGLKLSWNVENIFDMLVRIDRPLRELRDRVFRNRQPSLNEKLEVGAAFEAALNRERERLTLRLVGALEPVMCDIFFAPLRNERIVCRPALLVERTRVGEFHEALKTAAALFDSNFLLDSSGPWPPYSFVRLRLQRSTSTAA